MEWIVYFIIAFNDFSTSGIRDAHTAEACVLAAAHELQRHKDLRRAEPNVFQVTCTPRKTGKDR